MHLNKTIIMIDILVVTATLGDRETLQRTVDSVREIGGERVKHVIVAPKSKIEYLSEKFPLLDIIAEPANCKGIYSALNYGFQKFGRDYKYLTFINDDDFWLPNYKLIFEAIDNDITLDFVYAKILFYNELHKPFKKQACSGQFKSFLSLFHGNIILLTQQATLLRSELFFELGCFSEKFKLISDTKLWIDLSLLPIKFKYINKECAGYTIQENQLSSDKTLQTNEHAKLKKDYPKISKSRMHLNKILFRIQNIHIYLQRI